MKRITVFFFMLGIGMFLVLGGMIGCADSSQTPQSSSSTTSHATSTSSTSQVVPTPTHIAINTKSQMTLTLADNHRQIAVKPGTTIKLMLGNKPYSHWLVSSSQASVLIPWANAPMPTNMQGIFNAGQPGTAQISAMGQPSCTSKASSCNKGPQTFLVQIKVG